MSNALQPPTSKTLTDMFQKQRLLMEKYIILEDLPPYPLDLSLRKNQKLLKSFAYRVIEELGEAYDHLAFAYGAISTNHGEEAQEAIILYNEEIADATHFLLELMIFSGINEHDIYQWVMRFIIDNPKFDGLMTPINLLASFLNVGEYFNQQDGKPYNKRDRSLFVIFPEVDCVEEPENMGGRRLSPKVVGDHEELLWATTYRLTKAMNCLKARDWHRKEEVVSNLIQYNELLMEAFIMFWRLMSYTGKTELSIYNSYVKKNLINFERLKTQ